MKERGQQKETEREKKDNSDVLVVTVKNNEKLNSQ